MDEEMVRKLFGEYESQYSSRIKQVAHFWAPRVRAQAFTIGCVEAELVQEGLLTLCRVMKHFEQDHVSKAQFDSVLTTALHNQYKSILNREVRRRLRYIEMDVVAEAAESTGAGAERVLDWETWIERLAEVLGERDGQVLKLFVSQEPTPGSEPFTGQGEFMRRAKEFSWSETRPGGKVVMHQLTPHAVQQALRRAKELLRRSGLRKQRVSRSVVRRSVVRRSVVRRSSAVRRRPRRRKV